MTAARWETRRGTVHAGAFHLPLRQAQEMAGGDVVVEDHQDVGADSLVVGGPGSEVVAQVGGQALGHGGGSDGAALPLQEEGPGQCRPFRRNPKASG